MYDWTDTDDELIHELRGTLRRITACKQLARQGRSLEGCEKRHRANANALKEALEGRGFSLRVERKVLTVNDNEGSQTRTLPI